jgi:hypothetical protein
MSSVLELTIASPIEPWEAIGLQVEGDTSWIGGVRLRFVPVVGEPGMVGWTLAGVPGDDDRPDRIDGLATAYEDGHVEVQEWSHQLGATGFDHVVVMTSSIERTCGAIESATGAALKRIREAGAIRQGFHRLGPIIVEVVESAQVTAEMAAFWGFVLIVDDLHDVCGRLGPELISAPKAAVQPGRFIASFRATAGLGLPVALMTA